MRNFVILDRFGWPVVRFKGRPILNALRIVIHGRRVITREEWNRRNTPKPLPLDRACCSPEAPE